MATTTTNFGWDIPQSTDLVKDGATAIAALGQDIDTAFVDFKGGTTGQVLKKTSGTDLDVEWGTASSGLTLINTTSFSAVASQSINDVFSTTYNNYLISFDYVNSLEDNLRMRMRVSGADNSSANYGYARFNFRAGGSSTSGGHTETDWIVGGAGNARKANASINLFSPFLTTNTTYNSLSANSNGTFAYGDVFAGNMSVTTSYTGFTFYVGSGTTTGTVNIFGFNK
jgi:hypothetical protein